MKNIMENRLKPTRKLLKKLKTEVEFLEKNTFISLKDYERKLELESKIEEIENYIEAYKACVHYLTALSPKQLHQLRNMLYSLDCGLAELNYDDPEKYKQIQESDLYIELRDK